LSNVPYVYQENDYPVAGQEDRSDSYCGLASALMVRKKTEYKSSPSVSWHSGDYSWMEGIDAWLKNNSGSRYINIYPAGLVFIGDLYTEAGKYDNTKAILQEIYLTHHWDDFTFYHIDNTYRISNVDFQLQEPDAAMANIWSHISSKKQPVVVVSDSNLSLSIM
jgi:hypothetical protein